MEVYIGRSDKKGKKLAKTCRITTHLSSIQLMILMSPWHIGHLCGSTLPALLNRAPFREIQLE